MTPSEFREIIAATLAENPSYLPSALDGISAGMAEAIRIADAKKAVSDQAMLSMAALAKGRVGDDLREVLLAKIVAAIHPENQSGVERGYIDKYKDAK